MIVKCYAKVNLYLEVVNKRKDNYHNIKTLFERIDLADTVILKPLADRKIQLTSNHKNLPDDSSNLAFRSAQLLQESLNVMQGVQIKLLKRIPVGSGLGGGSSDAAAVLIGLNKLWRLKLSQNQLVNFAGKLGSDVAFFIYNSPFAQGEGKGERITSLGSLNKVRLWHVLVVPKIHVSTPLIYKEWDSHEKLTKPKLNAKILYSAVRKKSLPLLGKTLYNSLEPVTTKLYPEVSRIKEKLLQLGLKAILMSGSGPAVFAIVSSRKEARAIAGQMRKEKKTWQVFVARTI